MALTVEEETIVKLLVVDLKAKAKLAKVNLTMGTEIRAEFNTIDTDIRKVYQPQSLPLEADVAASQAALKAACE